MKRHLAVAALAFAATIVLAMVLPSPAWADDWGTTTWTPGTGPSVTLQNGLNPVEIISISGGTVVCTATLNGAVEEAVVAFALQYDADNWYQSGTARYFTLLEGYQTLTAQGANTQLQASIPVPTELELSPQRSQPQTFRVWVGYPGTMTVDPVAGVTGAALSAQFPVTTTLPTLTIIPPEESLVRGIHATRKPAFVIRRSSEATADDTYTLSYSGATGLLESLTRPTSVTIHAGFDRAGFILDFDPQMTAHWPGTASTLTITATSHYGSVTTYTKFSDKLQVEDGYTSYVYAAAEKPQEYCARHTVFFTMTTGGETLHCGACTATGKMPTPEGQPAGDKQQYYTIPYSCATPGTLCQVTEKNFSAAAYKSELKEVKCDAWVEETNEQGQKVWVKKPGLKWCYSLTPTGQTKTNIKAKDCD